MTVLTSPISAAIGSMKELGVADWRAADKAEPVKNQDCRDYTMTNVKVSAPGHVSDCSFRGSNCRIAIFGVCCMRMSRAFDVAAKSMYNWRFSRFESPFYRHSHEERKRNIKK